MKSEMKLKDMSGIYVQHTTEHGLWHCNTV